MIVRTDASGLYLITQPDHARLAARLIEAWRADGLPERPSRQVILLATREHDNGWHEEDAAPTVDAEGRPHDFIGVPDPVKWRIWPRGVARLADTDPAAAALVAQHALRIFCAHRADPAWAPFFAEIEAARDRLLGITGQRGPAARARFLQDYRFVYLGDVLSLFFCNRWTHPVRAEGYELRPTAEGVEVAPDPFEGATVPLSVRAGRIPARQYQSDRDLRSALELADWVELTGTCRGCRGS